MDINRSKRPKSFKRQYNNSVICNNSSNNLSSNIDKNNEQAITDIKANNSKIANGSAISINDSRNDCLSDIAPGILYTASVPNEKEFLINNDSETKHPSEVKPGQRNALIADNFSNVYIPGDTGRPLQNISVDNSKSYNDYVNKTYRDASRRQSVEKDIGIKSEEDQIVFNSIHDVISSDKSEDSSKPFLAAFERNNEKLPKSIVKSPSAQSFNKGSKLDTKARKRLSLQWSANDEVNSQTTNNIGNSNEIERPVLHVQFMAHDNGDPSEISTATASANRRRSECKSPLGSISSRSSGTSNSSSSDDDDGSSIEQYSEARAPDGGWGWVVVFASFVVNLIADGITFSFGVIFVEFLNYFGKGKAKTAWIGSLFMAIPLLSGPIASFLTDRYGCRKVTIAGSILACIGFVISSFSNSMEMLFFTFGILAGFGLSLCYVAAVVIVAYYFEKKRSFATGLSVCGSGIGTFIFAPLTQLLLEEYGWRGTTLILAGIFLNMCVCGVLMKDLEWTTHRAKLKAKERKRSKLGVSADSFSVSNSTNTGGTASNLNQTVQSADQTNTVNPIKIEDFDDPRVFSSLITLPTFVRNGEKVPVEVLELLSTHRNVHNLLIQNYPGLLHSRSFSEPFSSSGTGLSPDVTVTSDNRELPTVKESSKTETNTEQFRKEQALLAWMKKNGGHHHRDRQPPSAAYLKDLRIHRHSLTYRGAMLNINRYRLRASSCPDIYRNSMTTIAKEKTAWYQGIDDFKNLFLDILDFSYFADIRFLLFAISNFLLYTWYDVPYVYLTDNAIEMGIEETDASMLIGIIGIVNMFGEIALGWIGDFKGISASVVYAVCMALCGAVTAMVPLSKSYTWLCSIAGLFGLFIAANYALTSIILVELITLERFTNAYGLLLMVQGIANLVGPPLAGWIYDVTGTYDLSFYIAGFFIAISGLMLFILPACGKYRKYRALRRQTLTDQSETPKISSIGTSTNETPSTKSNGTTILGDCFNKELIKETVRADHV